MNEREVARLGSALRRWLGLAIFATILGGVVAYAVSRVLPEEYQATAQLYLVPSASDTTVPDVLLGQNLARSYVQLATADVVLAPAANKVGWTGTLRTFRDRVQIAQVKDTSVMTVVFTDEDPGRAASAANAIAASFIEQNGILQSSLRNTTTSALDEQITSIQSDIRTLDAQIAPLQARLATTAQPTLDPTTRTSMQTQLTQLDESRQTKQQTLAQLVKTRADMTLGAARADSTLALWQPAQVPDRPSSPSIWLNTFLGALSGLLVALLGILLASYIDDHLRDSADVEARLGLPALGEVELVGRPNSLSGKLFMRDAAHSSEAEAIRTIRANLALAHVDRPVKTLLVTSAMPREGKSVLSANLALAFAESGTRTILLDADLRHPSQHVLFEARRSKGLLRLLSDPSDAEAVTQFRITPNLLVVPAGGIPANPTQLLSSARMSTVIEKLVEMSDGIVIIDASPVRLVSDVLALSSKVDACLFVVDSRQTRTADVTKALDALRRVRAPLVGVVLNKIRPLSAAYDYYPVPVSAQQTGKPR